MKRLEDIPWWQKLLAVIALVALLVALTDPPKEKPKPKTRARKIVDHLLERPTPETESKLDKLARKWTER